MRLQARDTQARDVTSEAQRRTDLAERTTTTAGMGDWLTGITTDVARSAPTNAPPGLLGDMTGR